MADKTKGKRPRRNPNDGSRDNIYKRGDSWYVRFSIDGQEYRRSAGRSRDAAQVLLAKLRKDAERGRVGLPKRCQRTLDDFESDYMKWAKAHKRSWPRDQRSLDMLTDTLGHFRLGDLSITRVEGYMRSRRRKVSAATVNREVACLRKLLNLAVERGELDENPIKGIKLFQEAPGRQPTLTTEDERKLLAACKLPYLKLSVQLALLTGCRLGELLALNWKHVDFENAILVVEDSKSGDSRRVPLHPAAAALLEPDRGTPAGFVIKMADGEQPLPHSVTVAFRRAVKRAGLTDLRFHDLRHIAGSRLLAAGASLPEVASMLGHKTLVMARRYAHTDWNRLSSLVATMPSQSS